MIQNCENKEKKKHFNFVLFYECTYINNKYLKLHKYQRDTLFTCIWKWKETRPFCISSYVRQSQPAENTRGAQHAREERKTKNNRTLWMNQDLYKLSKGYSKYWTESRIETVFSWRWQKILLEWAYETSKAKWFTVGYIAFNAEGKPWLLILTVQFNASII